ncbi:MAG TPA: aminodeoxychorismate/anthranilate synthase component II [Flavobacteriales bacterium]|nr:aminodeoxychorismate/anthranilate synthase component II [Flavobacteriales bacterium]
MGLDMVQVSVASTNLCTMTSVRILMVDNRDSFTWNLVHDLGRSGAEVEVRQAGEWDTEDAERFDGIVLSPGPGLPNESPGLMHLVKAWAPHHPILGVCLGLQALVEWSGGGLRQMEQVRHGMQATALRTGTSPILTPLPDRFEVGHYHSWCADRSVLPACWRITSVAENDPELVLSLAHETLPLEAVQFHPESVLTPMGRVVLAEWLATLRA